MATSKEQFKVLSDREHVLARPNMYISSVDCEPVLSIVNYKYQEKNIVPGLIKIVEEVFQNSIDEHIRTNGKFADIISVSIKNNLDGCEISIEDNGRGIPVELMVSQKGEFYRPVLAWTELRAGSNFDDSSGRVTGGMNGVGSSLTNIFSKKFTGETSDGKKKIVVSCSDNMTNIGFKVSESEKQYTKVTFEPDLDRFGLDEFDQDHMDIIRDRLENLSIIFPKIQFKFNGEKIKFRNLKTIAANFSPFTVTAEAPGISIIIAPAGSDEEFRCLSYVNNIFIKNGGSHVDYAMNRIIETVRVAIKKKHKVDILPNQVRQHLLFASWISGFKNLKFDSQTKERITNSHPEVAPVFKDIDFEKLAKQIVNIPELIDPIVDAILRKLEAAKQAELRKLNKDLDKANLRKIIKFTDASNKTNREECMLFLSEGQSAANAILSARTEMIGCYALKGKPINALGVEVKVLQENQEFIDFLAITGLKIGKKVNSLDEIRFGRIVICTDADHDGQGHIFGLINTWIYRFWPELYELGAVYQFVTPIMKAMKGKKEVLFYSLTEFEEWSKKESGFTMRYLKGLGSSDSKDFVKYFNEIDHHLIRVIIKEAKDLGIVELVFGKTSGAADRRKVWLNIEQQ